MSIRDAISGFYAVLDRDSEELARALCAECRVLQLRIKPADRKPTADELIRIGKMARRICDDAGVALIVNDRVDVALAIDADGVHLGQADLPLASARRIANGLWIGISTHNLAQVRAANAGGADYIAFGPVFATTTKQNPDPVQGLEGLRAAAAEAGERPLVAIGGITPARVAEVYAAGAKAICAIGAVNDAPDVRAVARSFARPSS